MAVLRRKSRGSHEIAESDLKVVESVVQIPRFAAEFGEDARRFFAARSVLQQAYAQKSSPLPTSLRETISTLLRILDRLRHTPGVRLEDVERMMIAIGRIADEVAPTMGDGQAEPLLAEVELHFAEIHGSFGNFDLQRRHAQSALDWVANASADIAGKRRLSAQLLLSEAAEAEGLFDLASEHLSLAECEFRSIVITDSV